MTIESHPGNFASPGLSDLQRSAPMGRQISLHKQQKKQSQPVPQEFVYNLTIVIPTRNERDNIGPLLEELQCALVGVCVEVIFVDDSDDDTPARIQEASITVASSLFHIHLEHRPKGPARAGGLATAVDLGLHIAQATYVAVIDADLQHPPAQLRALYDQACSQRVDMVLASRYIKGGGYQGLDGIGRLFISVGLKWTAKICFPEHLLHVSDPLGGFFLLRRSLLNDVTLRPIGYKILMEILLRCPWRTAVEVPYHFQARANGQSKADLRQGLQVLQHIWRIFREIPSAGRIWKISALVLLNLLITLALIIYCNAVPEVWLSASSIVFGLTACLNLLLLNRVIFPRNNKPATLPPESLEITPTRQIHAISTNPRNPEQLDTFQIPVTPIKSLKSEVLQRQPLARLPRTSLPLPIVDDLAVLPTAQLPITPLPSTLEQEPTARIPTIPPTTTSTLRKLEQMQTVHMPSTQMGAKQRSAREQVRAITPSTVAGTPNPALAPPSNDAASSKPQAAMQDKLLSRVARVAAVLVMCGICYNLPGVWIVLAAFLLGFAILSRRNIDGHRTITMLLGIVVGIASVDYLAWRVVVTNWAGWWIAVPLLAAEMFGALHTLGFQFTLWPWTPKRYRRTENPTNAPIYIFIPTVNEGVAILEPTVKGALAARERYLEMYPHGQVTIVICNDGRVARADGWEETEALAQRLGVLCITRTKPGGAKAGNIEHARQKLGATGDALLVIFDVDQVAKPDFLLKTIQHFSDPQVGWVQTGQYYGNLENPVSRWADDQQAMFYNLLCPGKAALNAAFICGTNVVLRARALDQIGGLPQDSVTEDFAASITLHPHWRSVYLTDVLATGLGPLDVPSYLKQQRRWAMGTLGVLRTHWRHILLPQKDGLSLGQRVQYFLACTHYICGLRDLIYLVCPILFILTNIPAVRSATLDVFLWHFLPYWIASMAALWYAGRGVTGLRGIIIGFGSFPVLIESLLSVILQRKIGFTVTAKKRGTQRSWTFLLPYGVLLLASIGSLFLALQAGGQQQSSQFISAMWVIYSMFMLGSFLWLNMLDRRYQRKAQRLRREESNAHLHYTSRLHTRERGLRPVWNIALALLLASVVFVSGNVHVDASTPTTFILSRETLHHPYMGISLPVQLLKNRPQQLEQRLKNHFAIIGRTQEIHDSFDQTWAGQLAAQQERPWITLEFGVLGPHGKPPMSASLAAIANGVQDENIMRWAYSIRDYEKPVYLTILLHVDRNWSLSSAVANGGIPQDASRAWRHVRAIFSAAGATNVAWVWAPADPAHDQPYAPPASSIDAVLLSLISYPQTQWVDPQAAISAVRHRYPGKPLLIEASADGPAAQKAAWLTRVGSAVTTTSGIYALLYHEGAPGRSATPEEDQQWSMLSDAASQEAMQQIIALLNSK